MKRIAIIGISGRLGQYMARQALDRGYKVAGVCRPESTAKLGRLADRIELFEGDTSDSGLIAEAVAGRDGMLTVLVPWGTDGMATRTALAVLNHAEKGARLIFSGGWHMQRDDRDRYPGVIRFATWAFGRLARLTGKADIDDHKRAARLIYASDRDWTLVRASDLEEGEPDGLPIWARNVGDPILKSNRTRRIDFAHFMVHALTDDSLIREAPALVSRAAPSAQAILDTAA